MEKLNFFAGPSYLHPSILHSLQNAIAKNNHLSLLEVSHRSKAIGDLFAETKELIAELMDLKPNKEVLLLHGGASLQYPMIAYNVLTHKKAALIDTGVWSEKSLKEHLKIRPTHVLASGKNNNYLSIPKIADSSDQYGYVHLTSNNTIYGTQFSEYPNLGSTETIVDMSSDILSRKVDYNQFGLIYAGLQKNLGCAGACLVVVDPDILDPAESVPSMLDYTKHIKADSMLNTPPVFAVLSCNLTLKWLKKEGGMAVIEKRNREKSSLLYKELERNACFSARVEPKDRSMMNVTFVAENESLESSFLDYCAKNEIYGLKGHRLSGGFRASLYNSIEVDHVKRLIEHMQDFERTV